MKKTLNWTSTLIKEKSLRVNRLFPVACLLPPASIRLLLAACLLSLVSVASQAQTDDARYTTLLARLNSLKAEATQVEDLNAITRLGRAFAYYLDKGYFGEAANLFADEGRVVYGVDGVYTGRDRIKELFTRHGGGSGQWHCLLLLGHCDQCHRDQRGLRCHRQHYARGGRGRPTRLASVSGYPVRATRSRGT